MRDHNRIFFAVKHHFSRFLLALLLMPVFPAAALSFQFVDDGRNTVEISKPPRRVVSLVPSVTEIMYKIDAGDAIKAVAYHDVYPVANAAKQIVGGYFSPSLGHH